MTKDVNKKTVFNKKLLLNIANICDMIKLRNKIFIRRKL